MIDAPATLPRRIVHILGTARPEGRGIEKLVENLARHLDKRRYTIAAWFLDEGPLAGELRQTGLQVRIVPWTGSVRDVPGTKRFAMAVISGRFDIVHMHVGGVTARSLIRAFSNGRIVLHVHSLGLEANDGGQGGHSGRLTDCVIANSAATAAGVRHATPVVVYPGITFAPPDTDPSAAANPRTQGGDGSRGPRTVVGTAARLVPIKGIASLIEAIASIGGSVPPIVLEIAGSGPELEALARQAADAGASDRVTFLGWRDDIRSLMQRWDIYCQPSLAEGFGLGLIEAMVEGLPVVCSDVGGMREIVVDGETGWLVPPGDSGALRESIVRLAGNQALRQRFASAGRDRAVQYFSADREAAQIQDLYDSLLS